MRTGWSAVSSSLLLLSALVMPAVAARADEPSPPGCSVASVNIGAQNKGDVTIACTGLTEALGNQLADIVNRVVQNRLDPQAVLTKLGEVSGVPEEGVVRSVDDRQRQQIIQSLVGKPPGQVTIIAHLSVEDSVGYAKGIASALSQVGWQIEGQQIRRAAPRSLDQVFGVAIVVRDRDGPPAKAVLLKTALASANITAPMVSDPAMAADAATLWIGRRPEPMPPDAK